MSDAPLDFSTLYMSIHHGNTDARSHQGVYVILGYVEIPSMKMVAVRDLTNGKRVDWELNTFRRYFYPLGANQ